MLPLTAFSFSGLLIATGCAIMATSMFVFARNRLNVIWGIFCLLVFVWGLGAYYIGSNTDAVSGLTYWRLAYVGVIFIPPVFAHFVHEFVKRRLGVVVVSAYLASCGYLFLNIVFPHLFISRVMSMFGQMQYLDATASPIYSSFVAFFALLTLYSLRVLWIEYHQAQGQQRQQIFYFLIGSSIGFIGGSFSFLPEYRIAIYPYPNALVALFPVVMGYAALRYKLFSLRAVFAQVLVFVIWAFVGLRLLLSWGTSQALNDGILLGIVVILGILMVQSIIREVNQRERLQELNRIKSEYLSFASHQVKAPMTAVKGFAELIYDGSYGVTPEKVREAAAKIREAANRMIMTVNNILNVRRIEEGKMEYVRAPKDMAVLVRAVVTELQPLADGKGLQLTIEPGLTEAVCTVDEQYFRHVFQNVIENAIKYTDAGSVRVHMYEQEGDMFCSVVDSGRGISREVLPQLFGEFQRGSGSGHPADGTGLGLYIARKIVEAHGGRMWAMSEGVGKGSSFFVRIPFTVPHHTEAVR